jgi:hypothetical protein
MYASMRDDKANIVQKKKRQKRHDEKKAFVSNIFFSI